MGMGDAALLIGGSDSRHREVGSMYFSIDLSPFV